LRVSGDAALIVVWLTAWQEDLKEEEEEEKEKKKVPWFRITEQQSAQQVNVRQAQLNTGNKEWMARIQPLLLLCNGVNVGKYKGLNEYARLPQGVISHALRLLSHRPPLLRRSPKSAPLTAAIYLERLV
jgi:hypothetical protein